MLLYVINVEACIHTDNYRIFFFEPVAKKQLELFEASWEPASLTRAFQEVAGHINRRGFENRDCQILVCVRRRESDRWKETTLYARAMVCRALEKSGMIPVITGSYTRKVTVLFQVEQPYYGTVPRTAVWEEELNGIRQFLDLLEIRPAAATSDPEEGTLLQAAGLWGRRPAGQWEEALVQALDEEEENRTDPILSDLKERLRRSLDAEKESVQDTEEEAPDPDESLDALLSAPEEDEEEEGFDYISHRIRSLLDGSGLNRCTEVIYWPVAREISRANRISMLSLVDLFCSGREITLSRVSEYIRMQNTEAEEEMLARYRTALAGYREQLSRSHDRILQETLAGDKAAQPRPALSLPEISFGLTQRMEEAKQQLESCRISLKRSKRQEVKARVDEISQSLTDSFDGLEEELTAYEQSVTDCLYREIEGHGHVGQSDPDHVTGAGLSANKTAEEKRDESDEAAAKAGIRQWSQEMQTLIACTGLTRISTSAIYLMGSLLLPVLCWLCWQGDLTGERELLPISLVLFFILAGALAFTRLFLAGSFIRSITGAYEELEETLKQVLDQYQERALEYRSRMEQWLETEYELQETYRMQQSRKELAELASMRAWHLANMQKTLAGLETFQSFGEEWPQPQENPEITRRILQPMDYRKKELGNEVYWPVIEKGEGRRIHE